VEILIKTEGIFSKRIELKKDEIKNIIFFVFEKHTFLAKIIFLKNQFVLGKYC